ncbi:hypothetical protein AB0D12_21785 [Streptomyces sp. NPDC048479]|uniref:hypothetical protein n=1 Tax=Streptomyces sp. NPDC048479 TaxID=3154725 RepID=UPI00341DCA89
MKPRSRSGALRRRGDGTPQEIRFRLGLPEGPPLTLLGFAPATYGLDRTGSAAVRLGAAAARHWAAAHDEAAVATVGRTLYTLLPQARPAEAAVRDRPRPPRRPALLLAATAAHRAGRGRPADDRGVKGAGGQTRSGSAQLLLSLRP